MLDFQNQTEPQVAIRVVDDAGDGVLGIDHEDTDLEILVWVPGESDFAEITLVERTALSGVYQANTIEEASKGWYRLYLPASVVSSGNGVPIVVTYGDNKPQSDQIVFRGSALSSDTTTGLDSPVSFFNPETMEIRWTRGDDYVVENAGHIDILIDDPSGVTTEDDAYFRATNADKSVVVEGSASIVDKSGDLYLRIEATRAQTSASPSGTYNWDIEILSDGLVRTRRWGVLRLIETWTELVGSE